MDGSSQQVYPLLGKRIALFGPLALSFDRGDLARILRLVRENSGFSWIHDTIAHLPELWRALSDVLEIPIARKEEGNRHLYSLGDAFDSGSAAGVSFPMLNKILVPLVTIDQLTQYYNYLDSIKVGGDSQVDLVANSTHIFETLGFCTGLLSSSVVASAKTTGEFSKYGAVAIRLGLAIGAVADMDSQLSAISSKSARCLGTEWNAEAKYTEIQTLLNHHNDTYISVNYDHNRATITTLQSSLAEIQHQLRSSGLPASEIGLRGRYHTKEHTRAVDALRLFCQGHQGLQFVDCSGLVKQSRSNNSGQYFTSGPLHERVLQSILLQRSDWFQTLRTLQSQVLRNDEDASILAFGTERCLPPSLASELSSRYTHLFYSDQGRNSRPPIDRSRGRYADTDIAVVGMSCKTAGADSLEEFWEVLVSGKSQHQEIPAERFGFETAFRKTDPKRKWFGNFIRGHDMFDHKFFKTSPREAATTDPQQRQLLQVAYQAVEQSGYFQKEHVDDKKSREVACYIGLCGTDYENNIACHPANAFCATGNLEGFAAGKISHYFGWTGPAFVVDTACSSSAVAVHQACRAILSGECTAALAGGTHIMTSPYRFQNLAGASFLSTTGQCKPFDAEADGYCRGDGVAAVFLKKLSCAIKDGDEVIGVIASSGVQQNRNCTPIFVPNSASLSKLFRHVSEKASLSPSSITVVEAHGTGTAVGDPAEYESIRQVLGGCNRDSPLSLGSAKGFIGHTEPVSGVLSLIKVLLMMNKGRLPPQASFTSMSLNIKAKPLDNIAIPTTLATWNAGFKAALVNNYGASGSNASLILTQAPVLQHKGASRDERNRKYPFWLCGLDDSSVRRYAAALLRFVELQTRSHTGVDLQLGHIAFHLARQSNRRLPRQLICSAESLAELSETLGSIAQSASEFTSPSAVKPERPVILCFGGQVSNFVGLDRDIYERVYLLRQYLQTVDRAIKALAGDTIFPEIFSREPIEDVVKLQTMLFACQYATARCWIDSGVRPAILVGHSFGELTALCISEILSLEDALTAIMRRARWIRDSWGNERGAMLAVEADLGQLERILEAASAVTELDGKKKPASIACFNGPKSFTVAGSADAIDAVIRTLATSMESSSRAIRSRRLNVSNAFHCSLVDDLHDGLRGCGRGLTFCKPAIAVEHATKVPLVSLTSEFFAKHLRSPVYFDHALKRIRSRYPSSIFLEAGSNSTVANMASRAMGGSNDCQFQSINITGETGTAWNNLVDATSNLWRGGLDVTFWAHIRTEPSHYPYLFLPPYQFEQAKHWLELKCPPQDQALSLPRTTDAKEESSRIFQFAGYLDKDKRTSRFQIRTSSKQYQRLVSGHIFAQTAAICPATVQLEFVIESMFELRPDFCENAMQPRLENVQCQSPVCIDPGRCLWIEFKQRPDAALSWDFCILSTDASSEKGDASSSIHTTGMIQFVSISDPSAAVQLRRLERLVKAQQCLDLLSKDAAEVLRNQTIYRMFAGIVDYTEDYRGIQKLTSQKDRSAAHVVCQHDAVTYLDAHLADCLCQVAGIWANCLADCSATDMYVCNGMDQWFRNPKFSGLGESNGRPKSLNVLAMHQRPSEKSIVSDIFAFDAETNILVEVITGISYVRVSRASMSKVLVRLTPALSKSFDRERHASENDGLSHQSISDRFSEANTVPRTLLTTSPTPRREVRTTTTRRTATQSNIASKLRKIISELSGAEESDIHNDSSLADLGIDSLLGMELAHEVDSGFGISIPESTLMEIVDFPGLLEVVVKISAGNVESSCEEGVEQKDQLGSSSASEFGDRSSSDCSGAQTGFSTPIASVAEETALDMKLSLDLVMESFSAVKQETDARIADYGQQDYATVVEPLQTQLCIALILDALDDLGYSVRKAAAGSLVAKVPCAAENSRLVDALYTMLETRAHLVSTWTSDGQVTRTDTESPPHTSHALLQSLVARFPDQQVADRLTYYAGTRLAAVLRGETNGIKLIFGCAEGREMVSEFYAEWPLHKLLYQQLQDFIRRLTDGLNKHTSCGGPLRILEMGAGTGGTTKLLLPILAQAGIPVEYTFTDLSPSFVAAARKRFGCYPFVKFRTHNISDPPPEDLVGTQHIIIASNAVHATPNLRTSTANMRRALRGDGMLLMAEMTGRVWWMDLVFGLFEGWWLFDDGREYVVQDEARWQDDLQSVGYGWVDWTDGVRPENKLERLIIASAGWESARGSRCASLLQPTSAPSCLQSPSADCAARQAAVEGYVRRLTSGFTMSSPRDYLFGRVADEGAMVNGQHSVLVTGGTGSLGAHVVANLVERPDVRQVVCLNRPSKNDGATTTRQRQSMADKGLVGVSEEHLAKMRVLEADLSKPQLGLAPAAYEEVVSSVTHVIHNAWLMNTKWPLKRFEPQLRIMQNMIFLARDIAAFRSKVVFQFVSSIAAVGRWPVWTGTSIVPEEQMSIDSVLPIGYGDAKHACEVMLDRTLRLHPERFQVTLVRPGQIAGSTCSGYWNPMEHIPFLIKSSQSLGVLPRLPGHLSWTPVDAVAGTAVDILMLPDGVEAYPVYHIDNPTRQPWADMIGMLAECLGLGGGDIIPFEEWIAAVRGEAKPGNGRDDDNPASMLADFFEQDFIHMSCGAMALGTVRACQHSRTLSQLGPITAELLRLYVENWRKVGFLEN